MDLRGIGVLTPARSSDTSLFSLALLHVPHEGAIQTPRMLSDDSSMNCTMRSRSSGSVKSKTQIGKPQDLAVEWSTAIVLKPHWCATFESLAEPAQISIINKSSKDIP